jgi:hypothetical protein
MQYGYPTIQTKNYLCGLYHICGGWDKNSCPYNKKGGEKK